MRISFFSVLIALVFSFSSFADESEYDSMGCKERNEQGQCVKGKLTEMFARQQQLSFLSYPENDKGEYATCDQSCRNGCPSCSNCKWCWACGMYSSDSCKGVFFYDNDNSCAGKRTDSCCELCEQQCDGDEAICADGNFCQGGDPMKSKMGRCQKKVLGQECQRCVK